MKQNILYEGKAKILYKTNQQDVLIQYFKDDVTAFNNPEFTKVLEGKGRLCNEVSSIIMNKLQGVVPTHFISKINEREQLVKPAKIIPLEVVVRNIASGSFAKNYGLPNGTVLKSPTFELFFKKDELNDPLISPSSAIALSIATEEEISKIQSYAFKINEVLKELFNLAGITLVDFKTEFGYLQNGELALADEISPDTCRLWEKATGKILDKDIFRKNLGSIIEGYTQVLTGLQKVK